MTTMSLRNSDIQEVVKEVVQIYLQRRNYGAEGEEQAAARAERTQPLQQMAAESVAEAAASAADTLALTAGSLEPGLAEAQFARFRAWVLDAPEPYQTELQELLFPVFVNLHVELVLGGQSPARFYARHHSPFLFGPDRSVASDLAAVNTTQDLARSSLKNYRSVRPEVALSAGCSEYLRRALRSAALTLVLHVLSQHVQLTVAADADAAETEPGRPGRRRYSSDPQPPGAGAGGAGGDTTGDLERAISRLRAEPLPPPTICAYRVSRQLSCAALAPRRHLLVAGEERGATVWSLAPEGLSYGVNHACRVPLGAGGEEEGVSEVERAPSRPLRAHNGPVYDVQFEEEGELIVSAGEDTTLRGWSTDTMANVCIYRGHTCPVWSVACQRSGGGGGYFVSGSMDRTARLWSYERTYPLRIFAGHSQDVDCVALHPNGNYVATASGDGTLRLWTVTDAAQVRVLAGHHGVVHDLRFSPDGRQLAAAGEDQHVRVYDLGQGALVHDLAAHLASISSLLWTPGGKSVVSADRDGTINTWTLSAKAGVSNCPSSTFLCAGSSAVSLHYAPHNYLVAVYGEQDC